MTTLNPSITQGVSDFRTNTSFDRAPYIPLLTKQGFKPSIDVEVGDVVHTGKEWDTVDEINWKHSPLSVRLVSKGGYHLIPSSNKVLVHDGKRKGFALPQNVNQGDFVFHPFARDDEETWDIPNELLWCLGRYLRTGFCVKGNYVDSYRFRMQKKSRDLLDLLYQSSRAMMSIVELDATRLEINILDKRFRKAANVMTDERGYKFIPYELMAQPQRVLQPIVDGMWCNRRGDKDDFRVSFSRVNMGYGSHALNFKGYARLGSLWMSQGSRKSVSDSGVMMTVARGSQIPKQKDKVHHGKIDKGGVWKMVEEVSFEHARFSPKIKLRNNDTLRYGNSVIKV